MNKIKATDFQKYLESELKNETVKKHFDEFGKQLEIAYQILKLRKARNMSQKDLAERIGTTQSNIARLEGGRENFTIASLSKIADALSAELEISLR